MRWVSLLFLASLACGNGDRNPPLPGGGVGGGSGFPPDASPVPDGAEVTPVSSTVCVIDDLRDPTDCIGILSGVTVSDLGSTAMDTSDAAGRIELPGPAPLTVLASGDALRPTVTSLGGGDLLPMISEADYADLLLAIGQIEIDGSAAIVLAFRQGATPVAGASVTTVPVGTLNPVLYDQTGPPAFGANAETGASGVALLTGVPALDGTVTIQVRDGAEETARSVVVPVEADSLTIVVGP